MLTKLAITLVAALSIIASPVFAGPINHSAPNGSVYDFQLDGR